LELIQKDNIIYLGAVWLAALACHATGSARHKISRGCLVENLS